jgi:pilus assembly protein CpaC
MWLYQDQDWMTVAANGLPDTKYQMKSLAEFRARAHILGRIFGLFVFFLFILSGFAQALEEKLFVETGKSILLPVSLDIETVFISDAGIVDAKVSPSNMVFLFGKAVGETTVMVTLLGGNDVLTYNVIVTHQLSEIRSVLEARFPGEKISVESSRGSLFVTGVVSSEEVRETALETLRAVASDTAIIDRVTVRGSNVIRLQVILLEVSRSRAENFGIDWSGMITNNGFFLGASNRGILRFGNDANAETSLNAAVDLLVSSGIATIEQETILSTVTGEAAEFSVGGEIPVPSFVGAGNSANSNSFQLDYKFIGTALSFTPSIAPGNKLLLQIDSTVSASDGSNATVNGNTFPNLSTRSFQTSVELEDQQPFVIAGVTRNNSNSSIRQSRDGALSRAVDSLFGVDRVTSTSQELVVIVTPLLSEATPFEVRDRLPTSPTNLKFILSKAPVDKSFLESAGINSLGGFKY